MSNGAAMQTDQSLDVGDEANWEFFSGQMVRPRVSSRYQIALFFVAMGMILLPVIYLGVMSSVLWALYWWATHTVDIFFPVIGNERHIFILLFFVYIAPLIAGGFLALFMLKPIFASWPSLDASVPISHVDHPLLFRFIGQLCQQMGAPIPSRIDVNVSIGASAGFREGFRSMFGNDIMLTLGLPLAAGLTCREFACVVAHELGHFTQRTGMRMSYVIYSINRWLYRTVYERDSFDDLVYEISHGGSLGALVAVVVAIAVGFTRFIMWLLFMIGHALSSYMSRQMEFHADSCAIAVGGTDGFVGTMRKLRILLQCADRAAIESKNRVAPKYPDDLSAYLAMLAFQCSGETQGQILRNVAKDKTKWFSSHPANAERLAQATQVIQSGIIEDDRPAATLFNDFSKLSSELTMAHYLILTRGRPIPEERIFHVELPEENEVPDSSAEEAVVRDYFHGLGTFLRPILFDGGGRMTVSFLGNKEAQLAEARASLQSADVTAFSQSLGELDSRLFRVLQTSAVHQAGVEITPEMNGLSAAEISDLDGARAAIEAQQAQIGAALEPFEKTARQRLSTALSLIRSKAVASSISITEKLHDEATDLMHVVGKLNAAFPPLLEMRKEFAMLQALLGLRGTSSAVSIEEEIAASSQRVKNWIAAVHQALGSTQYPFDPPERHRTIVDYARAKRYDPDAARMTVKEAESHLQGLVALYYGLLARLIQIALIVETHLQKAAASPA